MAASAAGKFVGALCTITGTTRRVLNLGYPQSCTFLQTRNYAARKGTREKARKKKVKVITEKVGFIPHNQRAQKKMILSLKEVRYDDSAKENIPEDDVWIGKYHKMKTYPLAEAIECHKETHTMGMLDAPDAFIKAMIELDMTGPKPTKPVKNFIRIVAVPHFFDYGEKRTVLAFCKTPELQEEAKKAGATLVGGSELIPQIQTGEVTVGDYDHVIAHPNMMADTVLIKGLLKKKFPNSANGSLGINITQMVHKFLHGVKYNGKPHERQPLYGIAEPCFGKLNMETKQLEENFAAVISDLHSFRPKRPGPFIWRVRITTALCKEYLKVDHNLYTGEVITEDDDDDEDDDDEPIAVTV